MAKSKEKLADLKHYCYLITNTVNNKVYVGVTYKLLEVRLKEHFKTSRLKNKTAWQAIHLAIRKYSHNNFKIELLEEFTGAFSAYEGEVRYISFYKSKSKKFGYNETIGGDTGPHIVKHNSKVVIAIIEDYCNGMSLKSISVKHNIPYYSVFDITRLKISPDHNIPQQLINRLVLTKLTSNKRKRISPLELVAIITDFVSGLTIQQVADKYHLSNNNVWNIVHRNTWKDISIGIDLENILAEKLSLDKYWKNNDK